MVRELHYIISRDRFSKFIRFNPLTYRTEPRILLGVSSGKDLLQLCQLILNKF